MNEQSRGLLPKSGRSASRQFRRSQRRRLGRQPTPERGRFLLLLRGGLRDGFDFRKAGHLQSVDLAADTSVGRIGHVRFDVCPPPRSGFRMSDRQQLVRGDCASGHFDGAG